MKKYLFTPVILVILLASCQKDDSTETDATAIEIEVVTNSSNNTVEFSLSGTSTAIDWGDGLVQRFGSSSGVRVNHTYAAGSKAYTIKITDSGLMSFGLEKNDEDVVKYIKFMQNPSLRFVRLLQAKSINSVDFSKCPILQELYVTKSAFTKLDLTENSTLQSVKLFNNSELTSLKLNSKLKTLGLENNPKLSVNNIGLSQLVNLEELFIYAMNLTTVDLSANVAVRSLDLSDNELTSIDVSKLTQLKIFQCSNNQLNASALNVIYTALPTRTTTDAAEIDISGNPGADGSNQSLATAKNWTVKK